ncbi:M48 family metallopeptidase [Lentilactobacillus sp. Marseille-Q4993]|uniref:M48 family metallopeptidase n=1 Tax=Lentilactobacillus sp. Marseille-Q4993 TaxID=3039492 RepID=UPI0024BC3C5A|nr:M48 family metallopeptidase [Lentilactobacillus sp. Marseille-Q4993]
METINKQVSQNRRRTWFVMAAFVVVVAIIGFLIGCIFASREETFDMQVALYTMAGFLTAAAIYAVITYMGVTNILMRGSGATKLQESDDPQLFNIISDLAMAANVPMPDVYMINEEAPNAFATGRDPKHAAVAVTVGLRKMMNREELEGVIAHEISHIKNYDIRVSSITVALTSFIAGAGTFLIIAGIGLMRNASWMSFADDRDSDSKGSWAFVMGMVAFGAIIWLGGWLVRIIGVPVAQVLQFAVSRERESLADVSGVNLTRDPQGLIDALTVLKNDSQPMKHANASSAALYINEPKNKSGKTPFVLKMFDTHPPLDERIDRLKKLMGDYSGSDDQNNDLNQ